MIKDYIFYAAIAGIALIYIPWPSLGYVKSLLSGLLNSQKGGDPSLSGWDSDAKPCAETQEWAKAINLRCPAASPSDKWQYLTDGLSPIEAAMRAQGGEVDE